MEDNIPYKSEKDKYHMISFYVWNLKKWYTQTYLENRVPDLENKLWLPEGGG